MDELNQAPSKAERQDSTAVPGAQSTDWWAQAFDASYAARYGHRSDAAAEAEIAGILPRLRSAPGPVLDACCGNGRHLQAMRRAGLQAFGFDWSLPLLEQGQRRDELRGFLARGDMRSPPLVAGWGAITMLFTAFGYFDDAANAATFTATVDLLRPNGWFILDLANAQRVRDTLVPRSERCLDDGTVVSEKRWLDGDYVCKRSVWEEHGSPRVADERVRLYEPEEIAALAGAADCRLVETWPGLQGADADHGRQVYWIQRCSA